MLNIINFKPLFSHRVKPHVSAVSTLSPTAVISRWLGKSCCV